MAGVRCQVSPVTCYKSQANSHSHRHPPAKFPHYAQPDAADYLNLDPSTTSQKDQKSIFCKSMSGYKNFLLWLNNVTKNIYDVKLTLLSLKLLYL